MAIELKREELQRVRDHIAAVPAERFNMVTYFGEWTETDGEKWIRIGRPAATTNRNAVEGSCGSCACIAGHALALLAPDDPTSEEPMADAQALLGLTGKQAERLFEPHLSDRWFMGNRELESVTRAEAVAVLDHLLMTGRVSWREALRKATGSQA